jgi:uncharacterized membrane protein YphA (DoxX/SURF4 family)
VGNIRTAKSGVHETGNDPNTLRARDSGRATNLEKRDANTALHTRRAKPSAQMNLLDRLAGAIGSLVATRPVHFIALLGLCAAYIQGGLDKLLDFNAAVAETQSFGLPFAAAATAATIVTELAGSALILTGIYRWLGALWLAGFTLFATFVANRFWDMQPPQRFMVENSFFEHLGLIGGFLLIAWLDLRKSDGASI